MTQTNPLGYVLGRGAPNQRILEAILETAMDGIANIFDCRIATNNKCLTKVWVDTLSVEVVSLQSCGKRKAVAAEEKSRKRLASWCRHESSEVLPSIDLLRP